MKRRFGLMMAICAALLLPVMLLIKSAGADFTASNLIDDSVFNNFNSMTSPPPAQPWDTIDAFLNNNFPNSCISTKNGFTAPDLTGYSSATGYTYGPSVSAGHVIYDAAQAYKLNPQVILATLEKESSVVSGNASYRCQYINTAMGFDCPDSGSCPQRPATESGFSQQVIHATWLLKFAQQHAIGNYNWAEIHGSWDNSDDIGACYSGPMTQGYYQRGSSNSCNQVVFYDGLAAIDGTSVHMDTGATAALYDYTPHFHGNQLFVSIFESWFGPSRGEGYVLATSYTDNGDPRQWVIYQGARHLVPSTDVLKAWGLDKVTPLQWNGTYLGSFPTGQDLSRLMRPDGSQDVYFVDNAKAYKIPSSEMLAAWGFNPAAITNVSTYLSQLPTNSGLLTYSIRNASVNNGPVYTLDAGALRQYLNPDILDAWEGDNAPITAISNDYLSQMGSGAGLAGTKITNGQSGATEYQVSAGQKLAESFSVAQLYPGIAQMVSTATLNRLGIGPAASQFVRAANSSTIYLVDGGSKHAVSTPDIVRAWGVGASPSVNVATQGNVNLLPTGAPLSGFEADLSGQLYLMDGRKITVPISLDSSYRTSNVFSASSALMSLSPNGETATSFLKGFNSPPVYIMDSAKLRQIRSPNELGLLSGGAPPTSVSDYVLSQFTGGATVGVFVTDGTTNYLMSGGQKHSIDSPSQTNWRLNTPDTLSSSTLANFGNGVAIGNKLQSSGAYFFVQEGNAYGTVDHNLADMWGVSDAPALSISLVSEFLTNNMMTRVVKSSIPGDSRLFILDRGVLYRLYPNHALNLGTQGPFIAVDPNSMTVDDWVSTVVKDEGGLVYVIDGGTKRLVPQGVIRDQWTFGNYANAPTMTNGFLNTLPTTRPIERAIKASGPNIYAAQNFTKHLIQNPNTYNTQYAPYASVSDTLIGVLPNGNPL